MALHVPKFTAQYFSYDNWGTNPSSTAGQTVTPGSGSKGSYTQVATGSNIAQDVYGFFMQIHTGSTSATLRALRLDVGVDPAGGTSYTNIINDLICGFTAPLTAATGGQKFFFPLFIKAGSSVGVRAQGSNNTNVSCAIRFYGQRTAPETFPVGTFTETIGTLTNQDGVTFTPGNAANGSYTLLGTTTKPMWWWNIGYQISNTTITAEYTYIELAWGDSTNKHTIGKLMHGGTTSEQVSAAIDPTINPLSGYAPVPGGSNIYIRGRCLNAPDTGYNAVAVGVG